MRPPYRDLTVGQLLTRLASALPEQQALVYADGPRYTFRSLEQEARTVAVGLMRMGVGPRQRVVVWATNVPEWVVLQFALAKIGAILVTANTSLRSKDIDYLLRQSEASMIITISGFRDLDYLASLRDIGAFTGAIPSLQAVVHIGSNTPDGAIPYASLRGPLSPADDRDLQTREDAIGVDDVINMQYTSGTTGFPKGVMLTSRNIVNNGHALGGALGFTRDDRLCLCVPLFHCFGCVIGVLGAFTHGAGLYVIESFDPRKVLQMVDRERCTALYGVPTMFLAELECADFASYDLTSLRTGIMAGALCPEPVMRRVMTEMHLPEIAIAYGLTESSPGITVTPRDCSIAERSQTVGRLLPELEVKIIDPATGADCAVGCRGELCCRGYNVMKWYYNNPVATGEAIDADGWLHTGDEATVDAAGYFRITGRIKDLIIRGGENIAPKEVEDRLREHAAVADAYVYGVADDFFGEAVAAAVRLKPSCAATGDDLIVWCAAALAKFKVPKHVRFVTEFPMTASGKIQKYKLREQHEAANGR